MAAVSSVVVRVPFCATGALLTAVTVMATVAVLLFAWPSLALKVNESGPL